MRITIDPNTCIGCGLCELTCPQVFTMSEETGQAYVYVESVPQEAIATSRQAAATCPVKAITIHD